MVETTLVYISRAGKTLLLHRTKKAHDENAGMWIGVGGRVEPGETPEACMLREVGEETGLTPTAWRYRAVIHFISDDLEELMHLYTVSDYTGSLTDCDEGELAWIPDEQVPEMPTWEGDRIFLRLLRENAPFFRLKLRYEHGHLVESVREA